MKSSLSEFQVHDILLKYVKYLWKELELLKTLKTSAASVNPREVIHMAKTCCPAVGTSNEQFTCPSWVGLGETWLRLGRKRSNSEEWGLGRR